MRCALGLTSMHLLQAAGLVPAPITCSTGHGLLTRAIAPPFSQTAPNMCLCFDGSKEASCAHMPEITCSSQKFSMLQSRHQ